MFSLEAYQIFPYGNGASAKVITTNDGTKHSEAETDTDDTENSPYVDIHMIHDIDNQKLRVRVEGFASQITKMWKIFKQLLIKLKSEARNAWKAARTTFTIPCPHCLLLNRECTSYVQSEAIQKHTGPYHGMYSLYIRSQK